MSVPDPSYRERVHEFDEAYPAVTSFTKRAIDVMIASVLLLFLSPLLLLISLAIMSESSGPILFLQNRTGLHGRTFQIWKFRTMTVMENGATMQHASKGDQRVTPVGAILRKTHWDELPQLFNVLKGEMALIGPRPHAVAHDNLYSEHLPEYWGRFSVRPGLTGLAQVDGHRGEVHGLDCMRNRIASDLRYVREWSLRLDLQILLRTVPLLIVDRKAY